MLLDMAFCTTLRDVRVKCLVYAFQLGETELFWSPLQQQLLLMNKQLYLSQRLTLNLLNLLNWQQGRDK